MQQAIIISFPVTDPSINALLNTHITKLTKHRFFKSDQLSVFELAVRTIIFGGLSTLKALLEHNDLTSFTNDKNNTLLHIAVKYGNVEAVNMIRALSGDKRFNLNAQNKKQRTPYMSAEHKLSRFSLDDGRREQIVTSLKMPSQLYSWSHHFATTPELQIIIEMICTNVQEKVKFYNSFNKLNVESLDNITDSQGNSLLHFAVQHANLTAVAFILSYCSKLITKANTNGETPLALAKRLNTWRSRPVRKEIVDYLECYSQIATLKQPWQHHFTQNPKFQSVFDAIMEGDGDKFFGLVSKDSTLINLTDNVGNNLLHLAVQLKKVEIVKRIAFSHPALISQKGANNETPFELANRLNTWSWGDEAKIVRALQPLSALLGFDTGLVTKGYDGHEI